ncbi:Cytosolic carboxypeptidase 3 [Clydaea vesicula]|uniref:Cytosolic carboxypeptidase 3 n=1 Tax=Clydaea vesicula TaxID=447962 RepID=A0AAD5U6D8_9FUNG|nr:Cytosolic carboxypeptidase 3 [Clydaea vesicula]
MNGSNSESNIRINIPHINYPAKLDETESEEDYEEIQLINTKETSKKITFVIEGVDEKAVKNNINVVEYTSYYSVGKKLTDALKKTMNDSNFINKYFETSSDDSEFEEVQEKKNYNSSHSVLERNLRIMKHTFFNEEPRDLFVEQEISAPVWPKEASICNEASTSISINATDMIKCSKFNEYFSNPSENINIPESYFNSATEKKNLVYDCNFKSISSFYKLKSDEDDTLMFESRFESGNLGEAYRVSKYEYNLKIRPDLNTVGHTSWFYFQVRNGKKNTKYTFNIINFMKKNHLYGKGMKPLFFSTNEFKKKNLGFYRIGKNIKYFKNESNDEPSNQELKSTYTLTFEFEFQENNDTCYFANNFPYTYTDLQKFILEIKKNPLTSKYMYHRVIGQTFAKNNIDCLNISNLETFIGKGVIFLTARVHPGETQSSWAIRSIIEHLLGDSCEAKYLRNTYLFKIIPMCNPDGVIIGNHRCNLKGYDLNRQWTENNNVEKHATEIFQIHNYFKKIAAGRNIELFCDFHGHSKRFGSFTYGCENDIKHPRYSEMMFPYLLEKNSKTLFSLAMSNFKIKKDKLQTARVRVWKNFYVKNSLTYEISFCGANSIVLENEKSGFFFGLQELNQIGKNFFLSLFEYFNKSNTFELENLKNCLLKKNTTSDTDESDTSSDEELIRKSSKKRSKKKLNNTNTNFIIKKDSGINSNLEKKEKIKVKKEITNRSVNIKANEKILKKPTKERVSISNLSTTLITMKNPSFDKHRVITPTKFVFKKEEGGPYLQKQQLQDKCINLLVEELITPKVTLVAETEVENNTTNVKQPAQSKNKFSSHSTARVSLTSVNLALEPPWKAGMKFSKGSVLKKK